jgi:hypothetical protein
MLVLKLTGSHEIEETLARIRDYVGKQFPESMRLTGNVVLLTGTASDIVAGQIKSVARPGCDLPRHGPHVLSVKVGFLAILPNSCRSPSSSGRSVGSGLLNLGTSLIAAIALGIAVDSTVHCGAAQSRAEGATDQASALVETLRIVGIPIICDGGPVLRVSDFFASLVPIQQFGVLSGMTMATALAANLVLLPALLATTKIITVWDLLAVKLGKDPAQTIPFFAGLPSRGADRRVDGSPALCPGETIVRRGEVGGRCTSSSGLGGRVRGGGGERRYLARYRHGEVFGEMGLVRHGDPAPTSWLPGLSGFSP